MSNTEMIIRVKPDHIDITTVKDGVAVTKPTSLADVQSVFSRDRSLETPLLPGHWGTQKYMARGGRELYAISTPPHIRTVKYDYRGANDGQRIVDFKIPLPGLLWVMIINVDSRGSEEKRELRHMMAYSLRNWIMSERDEVFTFPFSNVGSEYCCWGSQNARIGSPKSITSIPDQFLNGIFNSDLDSRKFETFSWRKEGMDRDIVAQSTPNFFEYLAQEQRLAEAQGKNAEFRYDALRRTGYTVNDVIRREVSSHLN